MYTRYTTPRQLTAVHHTWTTTYSERHSRTPAVRYGTVARSLSRTVHLVCEYPSSTKLAGPVVPLTGGVLVRYRSQEFPNLWRTVCSERNFRTPSVCICTVLQSLSRTAHLGCEYTNCTYLGHPVAHCTPGVQLRYCSSQFTLPCTTICRERHFRTPSVRIRTVAQILTRTAHLGCVNTNYT